MNSGILLAILLAIITFDFLFSKVLEYLNWRSLRKDIPEEVKGFYEPEKYRKSIDYARANTRFGFLTSVISFLLSFVLLATGFFGWFDDLLFRSIHGDIWISLVFFGILFLASDAIQIPFQWYNTFVIEEKFGFNKTTPKIFVTDKIKGYLLTAVIGGVILYTLLKLIGYFGKDFWIYFWVVISVFSLFMNLFYTSLILPIFNKLSPLESGVLRELIEKYSEKIGFPLDKIYVMDGSKRSNKSNAFFSGFGKKKKIVLFDTLIENHSEQELIAVLAHEVGHYKKRHILWGYLISVTLTGITLLIMSWMIFNPELSEALGGHRMAIHLNLLAFGILYSPISHITGLFTNLLSRKNEFEADAFARDTYSGESLGEALKRLSVDNLSNLFPHPVFVFFNYSHPPLLERLRALKTTSKN